MSGVRRKSRNRSNSMTNIQVITFQGQRVLTTSQLAESYGTDNKRVSNNFNENKERYTQGKHYFLLEGENLKAFKSESRISGIAPNLNKLYLWTEKGAWLHAKSLNTDAAWDAYEMLVDEYYKVIQPQQLTARDQLKLIMQANEETAQRVDLIEQKVEFLHDSITIDNSQQYQLRMIVQNKVLNAVGGKKSLAYATFTKKLYSNAWNELKRRFGIPRYTELKKKDFEEGKQLLLLWEKPATLKMDIASCNRQLSADELATGWEVRK